MFTTLNSLCDRDVLPIVETEYMTVETESVIPGAVKRDHDIFVSLYQLYVDYKFNLFVNPVVKHKINNDSCDKVALLSVRSVRKLHHPLNLMTYMMILPHSKLCKKIKALVVEMEK